MLKSILGAVALSLLASCTTQIIYGGVDPAESGTTSTELPDTSSFGPDWHPTTGEGEDSSTGSTGSEEASSGSTSGAGVVDSSGSSSDSSSSSSSGEDNSSSSGPGLPVDNSCDFARSCELGVCSPTGECVNACDNDGRCVGNELCLAGACVDVGSDMMEAQLVAFNDSPAGAVSAYDIDVWKVQMPHPGLFNVIVSGMPVSAYVLNGMGEILATPDDAEDLGNEGKMFAYPAQVDNSVLPIVVILMTNSADPVPYYFYNIEP